MRRFGVSSLLILVLAACGFPYGFSGGGLPQHVRSVAVLPFDNETSSPDVQRELHELLRRELRGRLGVREASQDRADAVVQGIIRSYDADIPVGFSADRNQAVSARRKLQIAVDISIVDQTNGRTLLERKGLRGEGEYPERGEAEGRRLALQRIVTDVIEGAQSQW
jgi:hypothetical protein